MAEQDEASPQVEPTDPDLEPPAPEPDADGEETWIDVRRPPLGDPPADRTGRVTQTLRMPSDRPAQEPTPEDAVPRRAAGDAPPRRDSRQDLRLTPVATPRRDRRDEPALHAALEFPEPSRRSDLRGTPRHLLSAGTGEPLPPLWSSMTFRLLVAMSVVLALLLGTLGWLWVRL